ncbi:beta-ketoacyl-ACP synthase III [Kallotenue papyrolyticum]|uniref:beta-ketoacyl-ACP synthase III n=1 Tax=Kallotenue papyrolyticum TaxID=1325125 RepID=UPI0004785D23|nr:beta-ketoacyl-ACP synthase III [Kallotenue papyrolyticum]
MTYAAITGWGMYVPQQVLTNADLERMVDTSDEWIVTRTGIRERRIVGPDESTVSMAVAAARQALARAELAPEAIDLLIVATTTPDQLIPSSACLVQTALGATRAAPMDLNAACSGFVYALATAAQFIRTGAARAALVIGSDTLSRFVNYRDRNTCILFGDGAGAVVVQPSATPGGVLSIDLGGIPGTGDLLEVPAGGCRLPASPETVAAGQHYITMQGREVFKLAVRAMGDSCAKVIDAAGLSPEDVTLLIPHQANLRIIEATAKRLELPMERVFVNIDRYGNTSAGTIPIAICEAEAAGRLRDGDYLVLTAFGGGLTWGSAVVRWGR